MFIQASGWAGCCECRLHDSVLYTGPGGRAVHRLDGVGVLRITPISLIEANTFVAEHHRHHNPVVGHKFSIAVSDENDVVVGVCITGRPVSRHLDNGWTLEVTRCCTNGAKNAASMLYGAAWRVTKGLGYTTLVSYVLDTEKGTSLKAAGWRVIGVRGGGNWNRKSRPRVDSEHQQRKLMWEAV